MRATDAPTVTRDAVSRVVTSPPAFGTAPSTGPKVSAATFAEAEKLMQVKLTAGSARRRCRTGRSRWRRCSSGAPGRAAWRSSRRWHRRRAGSRVAARRHRRAGARSLRAQPRRAAARCPQRDVDIAFAPLTRCRAGWRARALSSERLTRIYLDRLERHQPALLCSITIVRDRRWPRRAAPTREIARGHYRGPLHGIPWGAKDLVDTAGIATT